MVFLLVWVMWVMWVMWVIGFEVARVDRSGTVS